LYIQTPFSLSTMIATLPSTPIVSRKNLIRKRRNTSTVTPSKQQTTLAHFVNRSTKDEDETFSPIVLPSFQSNNKITKSHKMKGKSHTTSCPLKLTQMILDAGQSDLKYMTCPTCQMVYCKGQEDDERLHAKVCKKFAHHQSKSEEPIKYKPCKQERLIERIGLNCKIISIQSSDTTKYLAKKAEEVRTMVESELGCAPLTPQQQQQQTVYFYVEGDEIIGCLIAQRIQYAHRIIVSMLELPQHNNNKRSKQEPTVMEDEQIAEEAMNSCDMTSQVPAVCGVSRIWVHKSHRRKRIAHRLLESVRKSLVYSYHIPLEQVAFSQPTTEGKLFAMRYMGTKQFLVFSE